MRKIKFIYVIVLYTFITSCLSPEFPSIEGSKLLSDLTFPKGFDWTTQKTIKLNIEQNLTDKELNFNLYYLDSTNKMSLGNYNLVRDKSIEIEVTIPKACDQLYLVPLNAAYKDALVLDATENINLSISKEIYSKSVKRIENLNNIQPASLSKSNITFSYLSSYNALGVPSNLLSPRDVITQSLLDDINASLPESRPVNQFNPEYITTKSLDTRILSPSEVWITFVTEGAGWKNAIGFYTYDLSNPPQSINSITNLSIIFPNSSLSGSGGGLTPGDKVKVGTFKANTGIGWVLFPNGWDGSKVNSVSDLKFSNPIFNTFTKAEYSQHMVFLSDEVRNLILLGFEDTSRPGGDNDFNDAVFYITANPFESIDISDLVSVKTSIDTDKDGVQDYLDAFPKNPEISAVEFYPNENTYAGLAFEDMWPTVGDYDFNDLVVDFKYKLKKDANNKIAEIECEFLLKAVGGAYRNGLALTLNCSPSAIKSVTGNEIAQSVFKLNANGTESGLANTVVPIFENAYDVFKVYNSGFINTERNKEVYEAKKIVVNIKFNSPQNLKDLGALPFNPFITVNLDRGKEIHLPLKSPTAKANLEYFNTANDNSTISGYYLTEDNLPWAILTSGSFEYTIEKAPINTGHLKFIDWATSKGYSNGDWYQNLSNYRNHKNIY
jgi:LruC domain-containing protein